jgi:eukaryotic translation initiation factor 2C
VRLPAIAHTLAEIKRVCDTILGVASQCLQAKHIYAAKQQYCANVALKINVKLGGMNTFLTANQLPFLASVPTIIFGCDILHSSPGDIIRPSIASVQHYKS